MRACAGPADWRKHNNDGVWLSAGLVAWGGDLAMGQALGLLVLYIQLIIHHTERTKFLTNSS